MKFLMAWILLTPVAVVLLTSLVAMMGGLDFVKEKSIGRTWLFMNLCIWWAIYFLIS